eukprot:c4510_g1_i1.p1 GENE.c4510_g1_i1~~c4510_g1_i1.p1  ORF type:complete len:241 (-),score=38.59 c4510_g1_i1:120-842(-)
MLVHASRFAVMRKIARDKDVRMYSSFTYVVSMFQCALWVTYAIVTPDRLQPLITNLIGATLEAGYVVVFLYYARGEARTRTLKMGLVAVLSFLVIILVVLLAVPHWSFVKPIGKNSDDSRETTFLGMVCVVINIIMYGSPLSVMSLVIKTKSVEFMPFPITIGTILSASMWLVYGLIESDINITIPNMSGVALGVAQLILYLIYCDWGKSRISNSQLRTPIAPSSITSSQADKYGSTVHV